MQAQRSRPGQRRQPGEHLSAYNVAQVGHSTMSFQTPKFYQKHGYETFAVLDGFAGRHRRRYLCKMLPLVYPVR